MSSLQDKTDALYDAQGCVVRDVPCVSCNYNLRTVHRSHTCPECGHSVEHSLREAVNKWSRDAQTAMTWLGMSLFVGMIPFAAPIGWILAVIFAFRLPPARNPHLGLPSVLPFSRVLGGLGIVVVLMLAVLIFSLDWPGSSPVFTIVSLVLVGIWQVIANVYASIVGGQMPDRGTKPATFRAAFAWGTWLFVMAIIGFFSILVRPALGESVACVMFLSAVILHLVTILHINNAGMALNPTPMKFARVCMTEDGCVNENLNCLGCKYNLRTLHHTSHCPECGRPVRDTLDHITPFHTTQ